MDTLATRLTGLYQAKFPGHGGQKKASDWLGIVQSQFNKWCSGSVVPNAETIGFLASKFGVTTDYLISGIDSIFRIEQRGAVAAGPYAHLEYEPKIITVAKKYPKSFFALKVSGKSCTNFGICDGDVVIVKPAKEPQEGRFLVVQTEEGYTLKGYRNGHLWRWPENGSLEPIPDADGATACGMVVELMGERMFAPKDVGLLKDKRN